MTNEQYKGKSLVGLVPTHPAIGGLAPWTRLRWSPLGALLRAQDTVPATSRRIVASWSLSGATDWAQPDGTDDPGGGAGDAQFYPTNAWRTLGIHRAHVTPGCELRAHVMYCPAGLVVKEVAADWISDGAWAEFRVRATWTNGVSTDGPNDHACTMEGSAKGTYTGLENSGAGQNWSDIREKQIAGIRPAEYLTDPTVAVAFSEWSDVELTLQIRGGARVIAVVVYEVPRAHVTAHDDDGLVSVHAMPPSLAPQTSFPQTKAADGTTYEEHRFGTTRLMQVAERQSERLGPRVFSWSSWNESTHDPLVDTENDPIDVVNTTSFLDLFDQTITTYSDDHPGWIVAGSNAQLHRLNDGRLIARGRFAVIPVRVRVDASCTGTGTVRLQSGPYERVDVTGITARAWYTAIGYLRSQVFADHNIAACQIFGSPNSVTRTLSIYNVSIDFGHWAS